MINKSFNNGNCLQLFKVDAKTDSEVLHMIGKSNRHSTDRRVKAKGFPLLAEGAMRNEVSDLTSNRNKFIVELF